MKLNRFLISFPFLFGCFGLIWTGEECWKGDISVNSCTFLWRFVRSQTLLSGHYWSKSHLSTYSWDPKSCEAWSPLSDCTTGCLCTQGGGSEGWWHIYYFNHTSQISGEIENSCFLDNSFMIKARIPIPFHFLPMTINCLKIFVWLDFVFSFTKHLYNTCV